MKTVLFIDKTEEDLWASFQKYDYLLDEYRNDSGFDVCLWNRQGASVDAAIPNLYQALGTHTIWQAVIVTDLREPMEALRDDEHFDNPFDFRDRYDVRPGDGFEETVHPLVRLTQMLGGLPDKVVVDWPEEDRLNAVAVSYASTAERYDLIERYRLGLPRPERIICVSPRDIDEAFSWARKQDFRVAESEHMRNLETLVAERENMLARGVDPLSDEFRDLEDQLRVFRTDEVAAKLGFWERNDYPSSARFVVIDQSASHIETPEGLQLAKQAASVARFDEEEPAARSLWFNFWMCVLALMVSTVLPEDLRAFQLYGMKASIDEAALGYSFGRRRVQWETACQIIGERLDEDYGRLMPSEYKRADMPDTQATISVSFDQINPEQLYTDPSVVALMKDKPKRDIEVWNSQRQGVFNQLRELLRAPRRALNIAADRFRQQKPLTYEELEYCILSQSEKERLQQEVQSIESSLAEGAGSSPFDFDTNERAFDEADSTVRTVLEKRATRPQAFAAIGIALATSLLGFGPYVLGFAGGVKVSAGAALVSLVCMLALVVVFVVTLTVMRKEARQAYVGFNDVVRRISGSLNSQAWALGQRLSSLASFRKKWAVLERQENLDMPTREAYRLGKSSALLKTRIRDIDEVARLNDIEVQAAGYSFDITWSQLNSMLDDDSFYNIRNAPAVETNDKSDIGTFSDSPYEFVRDLSLVPIEVV